MPSWNYALLGTQLVSKIDRNDLHMLLFWVFPIVLAFGNASVKMMLFATACFDSEKSRKKIRLTHHRDFLKE